MLKNQEHIIKALQIEALNPMQEQLLTAIQSEDNVLLSSETGTGKTIAFLLALHSQIKIDNASSLQALILVPTRELAIQIESVWKKMDTGFKINACYGGHDIQVELNNFRTMPTVLVGTPGRVLDHISKGNLPVNKVHMLVLDEFDKSLEIGFHEQMKEILAQLKNLTKRILVSATHKLQIPDFVNLRNAYEMNFSKPAESPALLSLNLIKSEEVDKIFSLIDLIKQVDFERMLIFCNHREAVDRVVELLKKEGYDALAYHGGLEQDQREKALMQFENGSAMYLVATDLAARGLDIHQLKHIVHYHLPLKEKEFIHRNGRTARMHASGTSYLILGPKEEVPNFIKEELPIWVNSSTYQLQQTPEFVTLYISGGKKNKLNKSDIVGFFIKTGGLDASELGMIHVKDFSSYVAVKRTKIKALLQKIAAQKMKGKKYKIELVR